MPNSYHENIFGKGLLVCCFFQIKRERGLPVFDLDSEICHLVGKINNEHTNFSEVSCPYCMLTLVMLSLFLSFGYFKYLCSRFNECIHARSTQNILAVMLISL